MDESANLVSLPAASGRIADSSDSAGPPPSSSFSPLPPPPPAAAAAEQDSVAVPAVAAGDFTRRRNEAQQQLLSGPSGSRASRMLPSDRRRRYSANDSVTPNSSYPFSLPAYGDDKGAPLEPLDEEPSRDPRDTSATTPTSVTRPLATSRKPPIDFDGLSWPSTGTRRRLEASPQEAKVQKEKLADAVRTILECLGEDVQREGLLRTPERYAEAMMFFTQGYEQNLRDIVNGAIFNEDHDEMVIIKDIEVMSLCEHHLVPFTGRMYIGYIPNGRVLGLSKFARIADMFSRRLQVQERLTKQVAAAVNEVLKPQGVAVVIESSHLCMVMRGVQQTQSTTTTSCMLGAFERRDRTRQEFLSLALRR